MSNTPRDYEDIPGDTPSTWEKFFGKILYTTKSGKNIKRGPVVFGLITAAFPAYYYLVN